MLNNIKVMFLVVLANFTVISVYSISTLEALDLVASYLPLNPVVLEAGSRDGNDAEVMCNRWADGHIHVFEPMPNLFANTLKKLEKYPNASCYELALNSESGFASMYICNNNDGASSLLHPSNMLSQILEFDRQLLVVPCLTVDDWAEKYGVDHIDFMWLDMEGNELHVLKASRQILKLASAVYTEINFLEFRESTPVYREFKEWLEGQGFEEVWKEGDGTWQGNALFVKRELINNSPNI